MKKSVNVALLLAIVLLVAIPASAYGSLEVRNLEINPDTINPEDTVDIGFEVYNGENSSVTDTIHMFNDTGWLESEEVTVENNSSTELSSPFKAPEDNGVYTVTVTSDTDNISGDYTVEYEDSEDDNIDNKLDEILERIDKLENNLEETDNEDKVEDQGIQYGENRNMMLKIRAQNSNTWQEVYPDAFDSFIEIPRGEKIILLAMDHENSFLIEDGYIEGSLETDADIGSSVPEWARTEDDEDGEYTYSSDTIRLLNKYYSGMYFEQEGGTILPAMTDDFPENFVITVDSEGYEELDFRVEFAGSSKESGDSSEEESSEVEINYSPYSPEVGDTVNIEGAKGDEIVGTIRVNGVIRGNPASIEVEDEGTINVSLVEDGEILTSESISVDSGEDSDEESSFNYMLIVYVLVIVMGFIASGYVLYDKGYIDIEDLKKKIGILDKKQSEPVKSVEEDKSGI